VEIDQDFVMIGGFSSGSAMSMQMHVAYSETFKAAALLQGNPYSLGRIHRTLNGLPRDGKAQMMKK